MKQFILSMASLSSKIKIILLVMILSCIGFAEGYSQIGYQVALINNATGEPRAMETVKVDLEITNSEGNVIFSGSQTATTNDFGILSLSVGDSSTFKDLDWSKLPFYISVKADGILIGKTEILSVPIAEYAKNTGVLTIERLCETPFSRTLHYDWGKTYNRFSFDIDGTGSCFSETSSNSGQIESSSTDSFKWYKDGNTVIVTIDGMWGYEIRYIPDLDCLFVSDDGMVLK